MSWTAKATKTLLRRLGDGGFVVDARMRDGLAEMLERSNGDRVDGVLAPTELLQTLLDAAGSHDEVAFRVAPGDGPTLTACLVARANYERWVVGVTTCRATDRSPTGCAGWRLSKWQDGGDNSKLLAGWMMKFDPGKLGVNYTPRTAKTVMTKQDHAEETELLAQILAAPADDGPRLVYADWLATRDPARSEFIVLQCQAETLRGKQREALEKRADELRVAHGSRWYRLWGSVTYRRGFPYAISTEVEPLLEKGPKLFAITPLDYVAIECHQPRDIARFATFSDLARIATLELNTMYMNLDTLFEALSSTDRLGHITTLVVRAELTPAAVELLAKPSTLAGLKTVQIAYPLTTALKRKIAARKLEITVF